MRIQLKHEDRIALLALLAGLPAVVMALFFLWSSSLHLIVRGSLSFAILGVWIVAARQARRAVAQPLQTLSNLLAALREGDYSFRGRTGGPADGIADIHRETNALADKLQRERWSATESIALLRKVMDAIDVAVFAFDHEHKLRLVSRAGESLLGEPAERLVARTTDDLKLTATLEGATPRIVDLDVAGGGGRWEVRRADARREGLPLDLVVLSNVSEALRAEERLAWKRLVRVLGHEINNSLAPIRSIADSLATLLTREPLPKDWRDDARRGLGVVATRAEALARFLERYATLARLPQPRLQPVELGPLVERVAPLETRARIAVDPGPNVQLLADPDQIEQVLINLLRNAADACPNSDSAVEVGWSVTRGPTPFVRLWIDDRGAGVANPDNLFVPFFTTKANGTGIGLVLSRQIVEAHGGALSVSNRSDGSGCRALVRLPLRSSQ